MNSVSSELSLDYNHRCIGARQVDSRGTTVAPAPALGIALFPWERASLAAISARSGVESQSRAHTR